MVVRAITVDSVIILKTTVSYRHTVLERTLKMTQLINFLAGAEGAVENCTAGPITTAFGPVNVVPTETPETLSAERATGCARMSKHKEAKAYKVSSIDRRK